MYEEINNTGKGKLYRCHHPFFKMVIDYQGNVVACCRDLRSEYIAGNVFEVNDIHKEIWNGEAMQHLRRNVARKTYSSINVCKKCDLPYKGSYAGKSMLEKAFKFVTSK